MVPLGVQGPSRSKGTHLQLAAQQRRWYQLCWAGMAAKLRVREPVLTMFSNNSMQHAAQLRVGGHGWAASAPACHPTAPAPQTVGALD